MKTSIPHSSRRWLHGWGFPILVAAIGSACVPQAPQGRRGHYPPNTTQKADTEFVRFQDHGDNAGVFETAIATYEGKRGEKVELISAVHIADQPYYTRLARLFAGYDSLLYEMVKPKGATPPAPGRRDRAASGGMISYFQRFLRDTLELEFQLDAIDYRAANFVHADLDTETFERLSKERGETLLQLMFRAAFQAMSKAQSGDSKTDPDMGFKMFFALFAKNRAQLLKHLLATQLQDMEDLIAGLSQGKDGQGSVILIERNKALMRVLHQRLDMGEKKIGVFYGGAHLADVEQRIFAEIGLRRTGVRWEKAWLIGEQTPKNGEKKDGPAKGEANKDEPPKGGPAKDGTNKDEPPKGEAKKDDPPKGEAKKAGPPKDGANK
jgi:hypothetical protein